MPAQQSTLPACRMLMYFLFVFVTMEWLEGKNGVEAINCFSCASPIYRTQWQATGFPVSSMNNLTFADDCSGRMSNQYEVDCPTGVCFEMLKIIDGQMAIMRGCHQQLLGNIRDDFSLVGNKQCFYGTSAARVKLNGVDYKNAIEGVYFCQQQTNCNSNLYVSAEFLTGNKWTECQKYQSQDCLSCYRFDGDGDCYRTIRDTCQGAWCTKTVGYMDGRWIEVRGCSPVNPYNNAICARIEQETLLSLPSERPITQTYIANQCYCQGSKCNGAATIVVDVVGLLALVVGTIFFS